MVREAVLLVLASAAIGYGTAWVLLAKLSTLKVSLGSFLPTLSPSICAPMPPCSPRP